MRFENLKITIVDNHGVIDANITHQKENIHFASFNRNDLGDLRF